MSDLSHHQYKVSKVWLTAFQAALGSFIFSYNIGLFTSSQPCVAASLHWTDPMEKSTNIALMSALLPLGALFGALGSGCFSHILGQRKNLIVADYIIIAASIITILPSTACFGLGRFISGIGIGIYSMFCPLYLSEIAPADRSGKVGSMIMLFGCLGSLFAFGLALALPTEDSDSDPMNNWWIFMFAFQGFYSIYTT